MKVITINSPKYGIKEVFVDDEDYDDLIKYTWCVAKLPNTFYAIRSTCIKGKESSVRMHRQILGLNNPKDLADHKDHNGLNNQRSNLRTANAQQNNRNRISSPKSSSKYVGVCWHKKDKRWQASIVVNKKAIHLGQFKTEIDAAKSRDNASIKYFGEFAHLNFK